MSKGKQVHWLLDSAWGYCLQGALVCTALACLGGIPPEKVRAAALGEAEGLRYLGAQLPAKKEVWGKLVDWSQGGDGRPLITIETSTGAQLMAYVADTAAVGRGLMGHLVKAVGTETPGGLFVVDTELQKAKTLTPVTGPTQAQVKDGIAQGSGNTGLAQDLPDGIHRGRWLADSKNRLFFQTGGEHTEDEE